MKNIAEPNRYVTRDYRERWKHECLISHVGNFFKHRPPELYRWRDCTPHRSASRSGARPTRIGKESKTATSRDCVKTWLPSESGVWSCAPRDTLSLRALGTASRLAKLSRITGSRVRALTSI